jgi:hypothetical protein
VTSVENIIQLAIVDENGNTHFSGHLNIEVREGNLQEMGMVFADVPMRVSLESDKPLKDAGGWNNTKWCYPVIMDHNTPETRLQLREYIKRWLSKPSRNKYDTNYVADDPRCDSVQSPPVAPDQLWMSDTIAELIGATYDEEDADDTFYENFRDIAKSWFAGDYPDVVIDRYGYPSSVLDEE